MVFILTKLPGSRQRCGLIPRQWNGYDAPSENDLQGLFLKGPVPLERIARAVGISGRALALLLAIHFQVDVSGQQWVRVTKDLLRKFGLTRDDKKRWLPRLAEVGLIDINNRGRGRATQVRLRNAVKQKERLDKTDARS